MHDGAIHIVFQPSLSADEYTELTRIADRATTKADLRTALQLFANLEGKEVEFHDELH